MEESKEYIRHHLCTLSGAGPDIFDDNALVAVHQASGGIPRQINELCLKAMNTALSLERAQVDHDCVRKASQKWWEVRR